MTTPEAAPLLDDTTPPTVIRCIDGEYEPPERSRCACLVGVQVNLDTAEVRACFEGPLLGRGEAIKRLSAERRARLFATPSRSKCGSDHDNYAKRLANFAVLLAIPEPDAELVDAQPKLAQARSRARHAVDRLTWHELRKLDLEVRKIADLAPTERADKIRSIATGLWLRRGEKPVGRAPAKP